MVHARRYPWQRPTRYISRHATAPRPSANAPSHKRAHAFAWVAAGVAAVLLFCFWTGALDTLLGRDVERSASPRAERPAGGGPLAGTITPTPTTSGPPTAVPTTPATPEGAGGGGSRGDGSEGGTPGAGGSGGRGADPKFDTCAQARAKGYGPYVWRTDQEYAWYRDEDDDRDGVVCD
ncbi:MAG TPA: excalibur calcium-binding domain-containing protein [Jiangellales bacterium]|nr:excalibur calcium-binding domain-containing protein [Jiangellales bacterium]